MLASGDVPDAIRPPWSWEMNKELIDSGLAIPLDDLLEEYGPNILKGGISESEWDLVRAAGGADGKIYYIPYLSSIERVRAGFIRKDWLDRVGMDIPPRTRDEYVEVLRAFKNLDANGNGDPNDEIPVSGREGLRWCDDLFVMHGVAMYEGHPPMWSWDPMQERMVSHQVSDQMKEAITFIRMLVEEGLMDPVMPIQPKANWEAKINDNRVGHYFHLACEIDLFSGFLENVPEGEWAYMPLPSVPGVPKQQNYLPRLIQSNLVITNQAKEPAKIIQWLDWSIADEQAKYYKLGLPGKDWVSTDDGGFEIINHTTPFYKYAAVNYTFDSDIVKHTPLGDLKVPIIEAAMQDVRGLDNDGMPDSVYDGHSDHRPENATLFRQIASKIIVGELPVSAWDDYVQRWYSTGGQIVTDRATEWYKQVYNK